MLNMIDLNLEGKRVLIRVDLNVPMQNGVILDDARIQAILPTLDLALKARAKVILLSHLGRPKEGEFSSALSLAPIAVYLSKYLKRSVRFLPNWLEGVKLGPGEIVLCENVRFNIGEEANDETLSKKMAALCDVFVMDAFATVHRAHASTVGIAKYAPVACAGPLLTTELAMLSTILTNPKRPLVAVVGGAKVSDKLKLLKNLLMHVNTLIVGGGIANTFLAALGFPVGGSLYEPSFLETAKELLAFSKTKGVDLLVPLDVVVAPELELADQKKIVNVSEVGGLDRIFDVGPKSIEAYATILKSAGTILWNGPLGVFEREVFGIGTKALAEAIAGSEAFSVAGGGETVAAAEKYGIKNKISYLSTGGGAFLEALEGKDLPGVVALG